MSAWRYLEMGSDGQPVVVTMSEEDIIREYYPYWQEQMRRAGKADQISEQGCIEDWVVVHWAEPLPEGPGPREAGRE